MVVVVMYRWIDPSGSWGGRPVTVKIADTCPVCGGPRGELRWQTFCEDGEWFTVNVWTNACGHVDKYTDVLKEAGKA